jgi:hypothetical protein
MNSVKIVFAAICMLVATGARAETWRHAPSGISLEVPADLRIGTVTDARKDGTDVAVQLGTAGTVLTFFVFRAAYPNPALWYERARHALTNSFGLSSDWSPGPFALPGVAGSAGLREEIDVSRAASPKYPGARSTAVAVAGHGEWLIKVRITSTSLDRAQIARLMDGVLAGVRSSSGPRKSYPMTLPGACPNGISFSGRAASGAGATGSIPATLQAINAAVRGQSGLAADPSAWCRLGTSLPTEAASVFARRDGGAWVALVGDFGAAISGLRTSGTGAVLYGSTSSGNRLLSTYDALPAPAAEVERHFQATLAIRGNAA